MARATAVGDSLAPFLDATESTPLGRLLQARPETVGAVIWPYQCLGWDAKQRLTMIAAHYEALSTLPKALNFDVAESKEIINLAIFAEGLRVVLDRPKWFMREGQLVINLFIGERRSYSLAFSLAQEACGLVAYVGAIQGSNIEGALEEYRNLTKTLHGMRPRDFLFETFRTLCRCLGVCRILAVADASRHHRSEYFGSHQANERSVNYDEVWVERRGTRVDANFFSLSPHPELRNLEEIPSKKRSMYRQRYAMLEEIEALLHHTLNHGQPAIAFREIMKGAANEKILL
jgi:uncharacterized protein VirK/YbjX